MLLNDIPFSIPLRLSVSLDTGESRGFNLQAFSYNLKVSESYIPLWSLSN